MNTIRRRLTAAALLAGSVTPVSIALGEVSIRVVALRNMAAPGAPGATFSTFGFPAVDEAGRAGFTAFLSGSVTSDNDRGVWYERPGALSLLARAGSPAPGAGAAAFNQFPRGVLLARDGSAGFVASLTGAPATNNSGIWFESAGALALSVRHGEALPADGGAVIGNLALGAAPLFGEGGVTAFLNFLNGSINSNNDMAIISVAGSVIGVVAREGSPAPSTTSQFQFLFTSPALNAAGTAAFVCGLTGSTAENEAVWKGLPGSLVLVAREDQPAPGVADARFATFMIAEQTPAINSLGHVAFRAGIRNVVGGTTGIWAERPLVELVARQGAPAPGTTDAVFDRFDHSFHALTHGDGGHVAFKAALSGPNVASGRDSGIWITRDGGLHLVAREGEVAPGTTSALFGDLHPQFHRPLVVNASGQVAFKAFLTGPGVNDSNNEGVWLSDAAGALHLIVREGQSIEVAPGDLRPVLGVGDVVAFTVSPGGLPRPLSDSGFLALQITLGPSTTPAIIVASLPGGCAADFNSDGNLDPDDLSDFITCFFTQAQFPGACPTADFNADGNVDPDDLSDYITAFFAGCP